MYSIVKQYWRGGYRLDDRDITNDPGVRGRIGLMFSSDRRVLSVRHPLHSTVGNLLPPLYWAEPVTFSTNFMLWTGWQCLRREDHPDGPWVWQEWYIEMLGRDIPEKDRPMWNL